MWQGILNIFYDLDKTQIANKIKSYYNNINNIKQESNKNNFVDLPETQIDPAPPRPFLPPSGSPAAAASAKDFFDKTNEASQQMIGRAKESGIFR